MRGGLRVTSFYLYWPNQNEKPDIENIKKQIAYYKKKDKIDNVLRAIRQLEYLKKEVEKINKYSDININYFLPVKYETVKKKWIELDKTTPVPRGKDPLTKNVVSLERQEKENRKKLNRDKNRTKNLIKESRAEEARRHARAEDARTRAEEARNTSGESKGAASVNASSKKISRGTTPTTPPKINTEQKEPKKQKFEKLIKGNESFNSIKFTDEDKIEFNSMLDVIFKGESTKNKINKIYGTTYNSNTTITKIVNSLYQIDGLKICPADDEKDTSFDDIYSNIAYILKYSFSDEKNIKTLKDKVKEYYLTDKKFKEEYNNKPNQNKLPGYFDEYIYFILDEHLIYHIYKPDTLNVNNSRKKAFLSNNSKGKKYNKGYYKILIDTIKGIILEFMIEYNKPTKK